MPLKKAGVFYTFAFPIRKMFWSKIKKDHFASRFSHFMFTLHIGLNCICCASDWPPSLQHSVTLKMEAAYFFNMTWCHNPQDGSLHCQYTVEQTMKVAMTGLRSHICWIAFAARIYINVFALSSHQEAGSCSAVLFSHVTTG